MTVITQTRVDTVKCIPCGKVTLCRFEWSGKKDLQKERLVSTAALAKLVKNAKKNANDTVTRISELANHCVASPEALEQIRLNGIPAGTDGLKIFTWASSIDDELIAKLAAGDPDWKVFEYDFISMNAWNVDADNTDGPANMPVEVEISDRYINLGKAREALENNPQVLSVRFDQGRPGSYDHVAASLHAVVAFTDEQWKVLCEYADMRYGKYRKAGERRPGPTTSLLEEALTWPGSREFVPDFLELEPYRRAEYHEPEN